MVAYDLEVVQHCSVEPEVHFALGTTPRHTTRGVSNSVVRLEETERRWKTVTQVIDELVDIIRLVPANWIIALKSAGGHFGMMGYLCQRLSCIYLFEDIEVLRIRREFSFAILC